MKARLRQAILILLSMVTILTECGPNLYADEVLLSEPGVTIESNVSGETLHPG